MNAPLHPDDARVHTGKGHILGFRGQWRSALQEEETAIADDPNNPEAYAATGYMSSIMRWRNGLMGLSGIAKAPVSHGVEPHDLATGSDLRVSGQSLPSSIRTPPPLPRERFSPRAESRFEADAGNGG
jgi:hypothetical protein